MPDSLTKRKAPLNVPPPARVVDGGDDFCCPAASLSFSSLCASSSPSKGVVNEVPAAAVAPSKKLKNATAANWQRSGRLVSVCLIASAAVASVLLASQPLSAPRFLVGSLVSQKGGRSSSLLRKSNPYDNNNQKKPKTTLQGEMKGDDNSLQHHRSKSKTTYSSSVPVSEADQRTVGDDLFLLSSKMMVFDAPKQNGTWSYFAEFNDNRLEKRVPMNYHPPEIKQDESTVRVPRAREIRSDDHVIFSREHKEHLKEMDNLPMKGWKRFEPLDDLDFPKDCLRPQWAWDKHPNCLAVHDLTFDRAATASAEDQSYNIDYIASGAFRDTFSFAPKDNGSLPFVVKTKTFRRELTDLLLYMTSVQAVIMEHLSASRLTSNIYGYCGTTVLVEQGRAEVEDDVLPDLSDTTGYPRGRIKQSDLDALQAEDVLPMNNIPVKRKLDMAIDMAEGIAEMHGFEGGVMTNDDIDLGQWLYGSNGHLILNDMNNAMFVEWNESEQRYCKYYRSFGGFYRSPEEYEGGYHYESVDVWPVGNVIFSLLTGLNPYYNIFDQDEIQEATRNGPPYIDPRYKTRSFVEGRMVEIMKRCHKVNPTQRATIFEVVQHLRETRELHQQQLQQQQSREGERYNNRAEDTS